MTPAPRNPCFRHEPEDDSRYDAVRLKPISTDPNGRGNAKAVAAERILAGNNTSDTVSKQPTCDRIEKSLLPLKKRATSHDSSDYSSAEYSFAILPKKRRRVDYGNDGTMADDGIPVQTHQYDDTVTVRATAAWPKSSSSNVITTVTSKQPLQQKKLMHDGIRSGGVTAPWHALAACSGSMEEQAESSAAGAARAKKNTNRNKNKTRSDRPRRPEQEDVTLPSKTLRPSEELSHILAVLGATDLTYVSEKTLHNSDVDRNQNRLLFSCKRECVEGHPITAVFAGNEKETFFVNQCEPGLLVSAFDGHGRKFDIKLKYLESNGGYRLITGWSAFVDANELSRPVKRGRRVDVELWAFRSRRLPGQPELKDKAKKLVVEGLADNPKGALGLIFIPYVNGEDISNVHRPEEAMAEDERVRAPQVQHETKRQASAKAVREEKKLADHHVRANRGKAVAREMTLDEVVRKAGQDVADSLIGLLMLSSCRSSAPVLKLNTTQHRSSSTTM